MNCVERTWVKLLLVIYCTNSLLVLVQSVPEPDPQYNGQQQQQPQQPYPNPVVNFNSNTNQYNDNNRQYNPGNNQYNPQYNPGNPSDPQYNPGNNQYNSGNSPNPQYNPNNPSDPRYNPSNPQYNPGNPSNPQYNPGNPSNPQYNPGNPSDPQYNQPNSQYNPQTNRYEPANPRNNQYNPLYDQGRGFDQGQNNFLSNNNRQPQSYIPPQQLQALLKQINELTSQQCSRNVYAQWEYETNINDVTQIGALEAQQQYAAFQREVWETLKKIDLRRVADPRQWRELRYLSNIGLSALPPDQYERYHRLISEMVTVYDNAGICAYNEPFRCGLRLNPDLTLIMARSRDWDELQHVWVEWRRNTGQFMRDLYDQLIDLTNQAAKLNNFTDASDMWIFPYESPTFRFDVEDVWEQIRPLYETLHAYVRRKLRELYGPVKISRTAPLPAHILGNMWAQSWSNILDITVPYPGKNFLDVTPNMQAQGYTPIAMLQLAEEFYLSLNMSAMPPEFWQGSVIQQLPDRLINCQASAWDFCNGNDYRIKMCSGVDMKDFATMHHELGHIQYFLNYKNLPKIFRDGANPGFHEAIGEAISLSSSTPRHLQALGLVQSSIDDVPHNINYLYSLALDKLPFLPFSLVMDKWRWDIFKGDIKKEQYNCHWHILREKYLGVKPPILRSEYDFDPGAKYHIPANIQYIRYFVGTVLQFQLHRALCKAAGQYDPNDESKQLFKCDIYRSKEAGKMLNELMRSGSSVPWQEALYRATGEGKLDGSAILEYFRPLQDWLTNENLRTQEYPGWIYDGDYCKHSIETAGLFVRGGYYNTASTRTTSFWFGHVLLFIAIKILI